MSIREKAINILLTSKGVSKNNAVTIEKYIEAAAFKIADEKTTYESCYKRILYNVMEERRQKVTCVVIVKNLKSMKSMWDNAIFNEIKDKIYENDGFIIDPFVIEEGAVTCGCGSSRVFTYSKQTRGCDESMTVFCKCCQCKKQWVY